MPLPNDELLQQAHLQQQPLLQVQQQQQQQPLLQAQQQQQQQQQQQAQPQIVQAMPVQAHIAQPAPPLSARQRRQDAKKQEEQRQAAQKAADQLARSDQMERERRAARATDDLAHDRQALNAERTLLAEQIKAIDLRETANLMASVLTQEDRMTLRLQAQNARAAAVANYARLLPEGSAERKAAMARKEKEELKAAQMRRALEVSKIANPVERTREEKTIQRHGHYDRIKKLVRFGRHNPLSREDADTYQVIGGQPHRMVNVGRAFMGGTKPMYYFEDRDGGNKTYLFKEAVNCVGFHKEEGALVTEAASRLQQRLCGQYAIPAFAVRGADGTVLGSLQEKVDTMRGPQRVDLFSWQAHPQNNLTAQMKAEILREHALDWLLCNFDTKGENFLHRADGHLSSFDKEASFSKLKDQGAAHMSYEYKPHANDTLYNTVFKEYAEGRLALDLSAVLPQIQTVEQMTRGEYLGMFSEMLDQKYGRTGDKRREAEDAIYARKEHLREEYRTFFTKLVGLRRQERQQKNLPDDTAGLLDPQTGRFRFQDDPPPGQ